LTSKEVGEIELPDAVFGVDMNEPLIHEAVRSFMANRRAGTSATKTRGDVRGGGKKPYRQKGTGRARSGSSRSPIWRGGGIVFGPIPRDYRADIPRKVRQLARRSALNARAREDSLFVVDAMAYDAPKTSKLAGMLEKMGLEGKKVLVLANGENRNLYLSGRNIPTARVMNYSNASAYDVIWSDAVVVEQGALGAPDADEAEGAEVRKPKKAKPAKSAKKPAAKAKAAKKAPAKKPAAKKPAAKKKKES